MAIVGRDDLDTAEARARAGLLAVELALRSGDPTPARRFVTEAFNERIQADLKEAAVNGWRRMTDDLGAVTAQALEATDEAGLQVSTVVVAGEGRRGWLDAHGHPVDPVPKGPWSEAWSMVRSADPEHIAAAREGRCQDCGAPVPEVADGRCPFCLAVLRPQPGEWAARGHGKEVVSAAAAGATEVSMGESTTRTGDTVTHVTRRVVIKGLPPGMDPNHLPPNIQAAIDAAVAGLQPGQNSTTKVFVPATGAPPPLPLPQDPADLALATATVVPLAALFDRARSAGDISSLQPYMAPALFEQEHARVDVGGDPVSPRQVLSARLSVDGPRELLSVRISAPGGSEDWLLERWHEWGPDAGWLVSSIQR